MAKQMEQLFYDLIHKTSTTLPNDIRKTMERAAATETKGGVAENVLKSLLQNAELARQKGTPICQDTGTPVFYVDYGPEHREKQLAQAIKSALVRATKDGILRPNAVHPVTGKNSGDNSGNYYPVMHFHQQDEAGLKARLLLKGGGSENVSAQYRLPDSKLGAGRDLNGVSKCVLDAAFQAQGKGCAPGILGIGVGGDRNTSYVCAKEQLFRDLSDRQTDPKLAALEEDLLGKCNELEIGPMGFGGKTTILGVKIGICHRLPASYFVSVAYLCWAARKGSIIYNRGPARS